MHVGMHNFDKSMLESFRNAVVNEKLGPELANTLKTLESKNYNVNAEKGKRVPNGFDKDHERADLLLYRSLWIDPPKIAPDVVTSPDVIDAVVEQIEVVAPLHRWLVTVDSHTG